MPSYLHPGVYVEEIPSGSKPIEGVSTSVTAFVGEAEKGPVGEASLIQSWDDYSGLYGDIASESDAMGLSIQSFYLNGGRNAYICRIVDGTSPTAKAAASVAGEGSGGAMVITLAATSVGTWGNALHYRVVKPVATDQAFDIEIGYLDGDEFAAMETFSNLSLNPNDLNFAVTTVNGGSALVTLTLAAAADPDNGANLYQAGAIRGGQLADTATLFSTALSGTMTLTLNINGLGTRQITIDTTAITFTDNNTTDGGLVADAIEAAIIALGTGAAYQSFTCDYDTAAGPDQRTFILTSGSPGPGSEVVVYDGDGGAADLANALLLNSAGAPVRTHGAAPVVPLQELGLLEMGTPLTGGDAKTPGSGDYRDFLGTTLKKIRDVSILVLPGVTWDATGMPKASEALSHCEALKNRMLLIDPPKGALLEQAAHVDALSLPTSTYAVLYYPWVQIANPFYDVDLNPTAAKTQSISPSAMAAGMWAKIDGSRGVWKAPAGVETNLLGVTGLDATVDDGDQDQLNPLGVNCIRKMPGFGPVFWGSRTLATRAKPEWRYVPVRRTAIFIERSIYEGIQWAVFEPNDHPLWSSLRANIESFMNGLFRSGAFQGAKASDAYFVRCNLGDTMTQADIDRGQVIVVVGFAPLKPAEFVIVRIQQKVGQ